MTKYLVYDCNTGLNTIYETSDAAIEAYWASIIKYMSQNPYFPMIEIDETSSE